MPERQAFILDSAELQFRRDIILFAEAENALEIRNIVRFDFLDSKTAIRLGVQFAHLQNLAHRFDGRFNDELIPRSFYGFLHEELASGYFEGVKGVISERLDFLAQYSDRVWDQRNYMEALSEVRFVLPDFTTEPHLPIDPWENPVTLFQYSVDQKMREKDN